MLGADLRRLAASRVAVKTACTQALCCVQEDKRDMLHAVYRVGDMATTIDYYKKHFGMKLLRYRDIPDVRR